MCYQEEYRWLILNGVIKVNSLHETKENRFSYGNGGVLNSCSYILGAEVRWHDNGLRLEKKKKLKGCIERSVEEKGQSSLEKQVF